MATSPGFLRVFRPAARVQVCFSRRSGILLYIPAPYVFPHGQRSEGPWYGAREYRAGPPRLPEIDGANPLPGPIRGLDSALWFDQYPRQAAGNRGQAAVCRQRTDLWGWPDV